MDYGNGGSTPSAGTMSKKRERIVLSRALTNVAWAVKQAWPSGKVITDVGKIATLSEERDRSISSGQAIKAKPSKAYRR